MRYTVPFAVSAAPAEAGQDLNTVSAYTVKHIQKGLTLLSHVSGLAKIYGWPGGYI